VSQHPVLDAARAIRLYLPSLLPPEDVTLYDEVIAELLAKADRTPDDIAAELGDLLDTKPSTRKWMQRALTGDPRLFEERGVDMATPPQPVHTPRYHCDACGYRWYRRTGEQPPPCPVDGHLLVADGGGT
jgi:hypothetical protein